MLIMQTETIPHAKVMGSIEKFGKEVIPAFQGTSAPTTLKTGVGKRRNVTDTSLYQEVSHEQEVYRPTFG